QYCAGEPVGNVDPSGKAYSPSRAVDYARRWYNGYNTRKYPKYEGGDCANFVSQCLVAGGLKMSGYGGKHGWWAGKHNGKMSSGSKWRGANELYKYIKSQRGYLVASFASFSRRGPWIRVARVGDLLFYSKGGAISHSTIVSASASIRSSGTGYVGTRVAQHTGPWLMRPWRLTWATKAYLVRPTG
ncbi:MAG: amidase domain-containing protein, partial [Coriobacteriia bacterium]|nr:amidase domain-containing protein [Coriobacteriia bacterium]